MSKDDQETQRLNKLADAIRIGDVRIYADDGSFVIEYRNRATRQCICDAVTLPAAIDAMDVEI